MYQSEMGANKATRFYSFLAEKLGYLYTFLTLSAMEVNVFPTGSLFSRIIIEKLYFNDICKVAILDLVISC